MPAPPRLLHLVDLAGDLGARRDRMTAGPSRIEAAVSALRRPRPEVLDRLLARAAFLAPIFDGPADAVTMQGVAEAAEDHPVFLDLDTEGIPDLAPLADGAASRVVRLAVRTEASAGPGVVPALRQLAARIGGRVVARLRCSGGDDGAVIGMIEALSGLPLDLDLRAGDATAREALRANLARIDSAARGAHLNVRIDDLARVSAGRPLDPIFAPNVVAEGLRAIFRQQPGVCPFPFLMISWPAAGALRPCPVPSGPTLVDPGPGSAEDPWNAEPIAAIRQGFHAGRPPVPCRTCGLLPRVLGSLATSREILDALRGPRQPRPLDV